MVTGETATLLPCANCFWMNDDTTLFMMSQNNTDSMVIAVSDSAQVGITGVFLGDRDTLTTTLKQDSTTVTLSQSESTVDSTDGTGWGVYVGVGILLALSTVLVLARKAAKKRIQSNRGVDESSVWDDMFSDVDNVDEAKALLKRLKIHLHPDRFVSSDPELMHKAEQMFQALNTSKHSLSELQRIEAKAREEGLIH